MTINNPPFLSIAIPTYNRGPRLRSALQAVFQEIDAVAGGGSRVEVVVCSNASTDDTDAVARSFAAQRANFRYFVNDRNLGIDENIRRVGRHASGRYVRFLSDDDLVAPGSLQRLLGWLDANPDAGFLFLNAGTLSTERGVEGVRSPVLAWSPRSDEPVHLSPDRFVEAVGVWLTFVSSFVVRRDLWVTAANDDGYVGTDIFLSYKALDAIAAVGGGYIDPRITVGVRPHFSGSYRIFKAFGPEWRRLLLQHGTVLGLNAVLMRRVWEATVLSDLLPRVARARLCLSFNAEERRLVESTIADVPQLLRRARWVMRMPLMFLQCAKVLHKLLLGHREKASPFVALQARQ